MELRRRRFGRAVRLEVAGGHVSRGSSACWCSELDLADDDVSHHRGPLDLTGLFLVHALDRARPEVRPVAAGHQRPAGRRHRQRALDLLGAARPRRARPPPLRELRHLRRGVHPPGGRRPARPRHQDDAVPHVGRQPHRAQPHPGRRARASRWWRWSSSRRASTSRPTSRGPRRLERAGVHVVYGLVGLKTHCKCVLVVRDEDDGIRRYLPHRHRQLQRVDRPALRGRRAAQLRPRPRRRPQPALQLPHRLRPRGALHASCWWRPDGCGTASRTSSSARPPPGASGRIIAKMNSLVDPR